MRTIRFVRDASPYNAGETASFPDDEAQRHVAQRLAIYLNPPGPVPSAAPAPVVTRENPVTANPVTPVAARQAAQPQHNRPNRPNR